MKRIRHSSRFWQSSQHQGQNPKWLQAPSNLTSPGLTSRRCRSRNGRRVNGANPLTQDASSASADQAAMRDRTGRQGDAQVCVTGCQQCGQALPKGSRRHPNRCQNVRSIRSNGLPKAGRWSGTCTDWMCKYGYHHTIVTQSGRLDAETRLAKGHFPLESLRWTRPSDDKLLDSFSRARCLDRPAAKPCSIRQPKSCPFVIIPHFCGDIRVPPSVPWQGMQREGSWIVKSLKPIPGYSPSCFRNLAGLLWHYCGLVAKMFEDLSRNVPELFPNCLDFKSPY
jgi:hypothetical protein